MIPEKRQLVQDLQPGQPVADLFVLAEAKQMQASNGPYWGLTLQDASGRIEARIWSPQSQNYPSLSGGTLAYVEGQAVSYRDQVQLKVDHVQPIDLEVACTAPTPVNLSLLVPSSATPPVDLLQNIEDIARQNLHYPAWRQLVNKVLNNEDIRQRLLMAIGGKAIHHAYVGGLLEHTLAVSRLCLAFCELYPDLDREVLLAAALFHDLGKAWELSGGLSPDYTDPGRLLGHIFMGLEVLEPFLQKSKLEPELVIHFKHIILSHHGQYEFGSPKRPKTAEAMALHYADNLDSKMNQFANAFPEETANGSSGHDGDEDARAGIWSPYQRSLERFLYRPVKTPGSTTTVNCRKNKEVQCSLLSKE